MFSTGRILLFLICGWIHRCRKRRWGRPIVLTDRLVFPFWIQRQVWMPLLSRHRILSCGDIIVEQIGTLGKSCYRRQEGSRGAQGRVEWGSLLEPGRHAISCASAGDDSQGVRNWLFLTLCKQLFTSEWWCFVCSRNKKKSQCNIKDHIEQ